MTEVLKLYKLIILYMLNKVDFPLTNSQLSEFILNEGYTTYFKLQQAISELINSGFIREESTHSRTFYHLTEEGAETIRYFKNDISPAIKSDIDKFLHEKEYELKDEVSVKSDYYRNSNGEYSITSPTEEEASRAANSWQQKNQEIYALIMKNLFSNRKE